MMSTAITRQTGKLLASATVALVRQGADGPELSLMLRHGNTSFADSYVFPGGLLEAQDLAVDGNCVGVDANTANARLDVGSGGLAYYSAAARELFEEAGVLLARTANGDWADACALADYREALRAGRESWPGFLQRYRLMLACEAMHYFAFWVTPRELPKRFSTRFFLAEMPAGQSASHCGVELLDSRWMTPGAALASGQKDSLRLPHPTRVSLETLARFDTVDSMLNWAKGESLRGVHRMQPAIISVDGTQTAVRPDDDRYPDYQTADLSADQLCDV